MYLCLCNSSLRSIEALLVEAPWDFETLRPKQRHYQTKFHENLQQEFPVWYMPRIPTYSTVMVANAISKLHTFWCSSHSSDANNRFTQRSCTKIDSAHACGYLWPISVLRQSLWAESCKSHWKSSIHCLQGIVAKRMAFTSHRESP